MPLIISDFCLILWGTDHVEDRFRTITWYTDVQADSYLGGYLIASDQGIVSDIEIQFSEYQLTVGELISQIGESSIVNISVYECVSFITYSNVGVIAWLYPQGSFGGVRASQSIFALQLMSVEALQTWSITDHIAVDWEGYEDYCELAEDQLPIMA